MIKMQSNKVFALLLAAGLLVGIDALADNSNARNNAGQGSNQALAQEKRAEIKAQNVCEKISEWENRLKQKTNEQENAIRNSQVGRLQKWTQKTEQAEFDLAANRKAWDRNRAQQFDKLETAAKTDAEKQAVSDFEAAVKTAVSAKRSAVDAANKAFRDGVHNAILARRDQIDIVVSNFSDAREAAIQKIEGDCSSGADANTIRSNFKIAMQSARTLFQADRKNVTRVGTAIQALIQTRRQAMVKAMGDFKAAMEKARVTLKSTMPSTES